MTSVSVDASEVGAFSQSTLTAGSVCDCCVAVIHREGHGLGLEDNALRLLVPMP